VPIETTVVGNSDLEHAIKLGEEEMAEHADRFADSEESDCLIINVRYARESGVDPIQEPQQAAWFFESLGSACSRHRTLKIEVWMGSSGSGT